MTTLDPNPDPAVLPAIEQLGYEQAFNELEKIVLALESNEGALEQALALFERGQLLARHCAALLDQAELKMAQVSDGALVDFRLPE